MCHHVRSLFLFHTYKWFSSIKINLIASCKLFLDFFSRFSVHSNQKLCVTVLPLTVLCVSVSHHVTPLKVAYLRRDVMETVTGEVEFSQSEDLAHTLGEHT